MKRHILCLVLLTSLMPGCTWVKNDLTAESIIANAIEAYGGEEALRGISSKTIQGTTLIYIYDSLFRSSPYLSYEKSPSKSHYVSPPGGEGYGERLIFASNGSSSWTQNDGALHPYRQPPEEHRNSGGEDFPYLFTLEERGVAVQYIETISEEGLTLHRVDYISENSTQEVYFNASTWLIFKMRRYIETSQGRAENIRFYRDYRDVSGTRVSFRTESFFPPRELDVHLINKMEINTPLDDSLFEFPEAPELTVTELDRFTGSYRISAETTIQIVRENSTLLVSVNDGPGVAAQIVAPDFLMYRDGVGDGSRVANVFIKTDSNNKDYLEHTLRKETVAAYKN
ncbi:MAG: hypothetical protein HEP71_09175 [Roseivirga sp.]|nr:hypothetical protein [Roseivirga sp.]